MSQKKQIKAFAANHKGHTLTATGLARALGWDKRDEIGKGENVVVRISYKSKTALKLAKKVGAKIQHAGKEEPFAITF